MSRFVHVSGPAVPSASKINCWEHSPTTGGTVAGGNTGNTGTVVVVVVVDGGGVGVVVVVVVVVDGTVVVSVGAGAAWCDLWA